MVVRVVGSDPGHGADVCRIVVRDDLAAQHVVLQVTLLRRTFETRESKVLDRARRILNSIQLFVGILSDIRNPKLVRARSYGEAVWISESRRHDEVVGGRALSDQRVVGRCCNGTARHVEPEQRAPVSNRIAVAEQILAAEASALGGIGVRDGSWITAWVHRASVLPDVVEGEAGAVTTSHV